MSVWSVLNIGQPHFSTLNLENYGIGLKSKGNMKNHDRYPERPCKHTLKTAPTINERRDEWSQRCIDCMEKLPFKWEPITEGAWYWGSMLWIVGLIMFGFLVLIGG